MDLVCITFGLTFLWVGILFILGRLHVHLRAWQRMTEQERAVIRIEALCCNIGTMIALSGLIFLWAGLSSRFRELVFAWAMVGWLVLCGADVWYIDKKGRYDRS